jgi:hypothetical protein
MNVQPVDFGYELRRNGIKQKLSLTREKQLIGFVLKLLKSDFSTGVGLQMCVEQIVLLHTRFPGRVCQNAGTEFLKVHTDPVEGEATSAVGTFNHRQCLAEVFSCGML